MNIPTFAFIKRRCKKTGSFHTSQYEKGAFSESTIDLVGGGLAVITDCRS